MSLRSSETSTLGIEVDAAAERYTAAVYAYRRSDETYSEKRIRDAHRELIVQLTQVALDRSQPGEELQEIKAVATEFAEYPNIPSYTIKQLKTRMLEQAVSLLSSRNCLPQQESASTR